MVVGFPRKVALMGSGILARQALTAKEIADSWYPSFAPLFLRRKCAAPQTFGVLCAFRGLWVQFFSVIFSSLVTFCAGPRLC